MLEICAGIVIIACIVLILYLLTKSKGPVSIEKKMEAGNTTLKIKANNDIKLIEIKSEEGEEIYLVRKGLKKDGVVEFVFPAPRNRVKVLVQDASGSHVLQA